MASLWEIGKSRRVLYIGQTQLGLDTKKWQLRGKTGRIWSLNEYRDGESQGLKVIPTQLAVL